MSNTIGQFDHTTTKLRKGDNGLPFNPWVNICLKHWVGVEKGSGAPLLSANLMTEQEIDFHIQALKDNLDAVGKRAKKALKDAQTSTLDLVKNESQKEEG